jgi:hypothetical protein
MNLRFHLEDLTFVFTQFTVLKSYSAGEWKMTLTEAKSAASTAEQHFEFLVGARFVGMNKWHWYRARAAVRGENCRRNDDTSHDTALAADMVIAEAYDLYIKALHKFYVMRDGPNGVLGGRGL